MGVLSKILERRIVWKTLKRGHGPHQYLLITKNTDEE